MVPLATLLARNVLLVVLALVTARVVASASLPLEPVDEASRRPSGLP
jgi:hypothetical protein